MNFLYRFIKILFRKQILKHFEEMELARETEFKINYQAAAEYAVALGERLAKQKNTPSGLNQME